MKRKRPVKMTAKQKEIMGLVLKRAGEGCFMTISELYDVISYKNECTYGAIRKSLEVLEKAGMLIRERRAGAVEKELKPTNLGYDWFRPLR